MKAPANKWPPMNHSPTTIESTETVEFPIRKEIFRSICDFADPPLNDWETLLGEISQGWADRSDLQVVQGYLAGLPGARAEFGERLSCVSAYIRMRNSRLARPLGAAALEDLSQDCHIAILQASESYNGESPIAAWAHGFVRFAFLRYFRAQHGESSTMRVLQREFVEPETTDQEISDSTVVASALSTLTDIERRTLSMRIMEEASFPEIAAALQEPVSSTKSRYVRLVVRLGSQLQTIWKNDYNEGNE